MSDQVESAGKNSIRGPMPPCAQFFDILSDTDRSELIEWAIASQPAFKPAKVYLHGGVSALDPDLKLREFGSMKTMLHERLFALLPEIMEQTGYRGPPPLSLELELGAYGDGAHFNAHIDLLTGSQDAATAEHRVLSAVYYFYNEPKGFSGGALRLFRFGISEAVAEDDLLSFEPRQNSLVAFPSWQDTRWKK